MPFFEDMDIDGIVEDHSKQISALQEKQARELVAAYSRVRLELQDRLAHTRGNTFTAQHLRGVLAQVDGALIAMQEQMKHKAAQGAFDASAMSLRHLIAEIHKFERKFRGAVVPINLDQVNVALNTKDFLINKYDASLKAYTAAERRKIVSKLTDAVIEQKTLDETIQGINRFFKGDEWEINRIARTELHHVYSTAKLNGMRELQKDTLPDLKKALYHPMDSRTGEDSIELAADNPIIGVSEYFEQWYRATPKSKWVHYRFLTPPNRPNDRAILVPYRDAWGD